MQIILNCSKCEKETTHYVITIIGGSNGYPATRFVCSVCTGIQDVPAKKTSPKFLQKMVLK